MSDAPQADLFDAACENCARECDAAELFAVHRVYLNLDEWNEVIESRVMEEVESWCASCRSIYPHEPVELER